MPRKSANPLTGAERWLTPGDWLEHAVALYAQHELALGQIAAEAYDEVLYLILHTLGLPMDSDERVLNHKLTTAQRESLALVFRRRILEHTPAAYITREAWLNDLRFHVDERVLIPRSYFLEIIPRLGEKAGGRTSARHWGMKRNQVQRVVDVCTGSGCLAIVLAKHFPQARVDAVDLSSDALEVAKINVRAHGLESRIALHRSDVFDAVPPVKYDVILSNPPYEPSAHCDQLPVEFTREPRLALDGGHDGLDIIRKLLRQSRERLTAQGIVLIEVGGLGPAMDRVFKALKPQWLETADGSNCVCLITAERLQAWQ